MYHTCHPKDTGFDLWTKVLLLGSQYALWFVVSRDKLLCILTNLIYLFPVCFHIFFFFHLALWCSFKYFFWVHVLFTLFLPFWTFTALNFVFCLCYCYFHVSIGITTCHSCWWTLSPMNGLCCITISGQTLQSLTWNAHHFGF